MKKLLSFLLLASITAFMSCSKGDMGPAGKDGQDGIDGTDGQDGNANVKNTVMTLSASDWVFFSSDIWYVDLQVPTVTTDIASTGLVMVYFQEAIGEWYALPFSRGSQSYNFWVMSERVRIHSQNSSIAPTKFTGKVRIVAVSSEGRARNPNLDWTDYEVVKEHFQLPD